MSIRQNVYSTKCPVDKMSNFQNVYSTKCPIFLKKFLKFFSNFQVNKLDGTNLKEIYAKGSNTQKQLVCSLEPFNDYSLTLEAHNLFGYSKATKTSFKTEQVFF